MLLRRAGLTASAGLSCYISVYLNSDLKILTILIDHLLCLDFHRSWLAQFE